jgi:CubicO group peptidase (beta-lactamase class C family)
LASSRTPEHALAAFERIVREAQSEARLPSLSAATFRGGEVLWQRALGLADADGGEEATLDHQYAIASITKTFVAACVLQLRDEGALALADPLSRHVPGVAHGALTIRSMLSHLSGLQREPPGEIWETLRAPSREELLAGLAEAERVLPPDQEWHYSNLAYALLGEVVASASGIGFERYLEERLLGPLRLERTGWTPAQPARPYYVEPYSDVVSVEPGLALGGTSAAGGLWSTSGDLARWAGFLADPDPSILSRESAAQMRSVQTMLDLETWTSAHGLGLQLWRRGERVFAGHTGGLPGFVSIVAWLPSEKVGGAILTSSGAWPALTETGLKLAQAAAEELAGLPEEWRPGREPPADVASLLGRWWSEGSEFVFAWRDETLEARVADVPGVLPPATFEREGPDRWRTVSGRERGELLRVVRGDDGSARKLYWATYPFTRAPQSFGAGVGRAPVEEAAAGES